MLKQVLAAGTVLLLSAYLCAAEEISDMRVVNGRCISSSHIAEGPIGSDLRKRRSRFFCDGMVLATFGVSKDHTLVQFTEKESHHGQIIGYGGMMVPGQNIMMVDHVYLTNGVATPVTEGFCKFFRTDTRVSFRIFLQSNPLIWRIMRRED